MMKWENKQKVRIINIKRLDAELGETDQRNQKQLNTMELEDSFREDQKRMNLK